MGGLAAGRFSRAATGGGGHPSPTGSKLAGPLQPEYCLGTDGLGCGRRRLRFEDGCGHWGAVCFEGYARGVDPR
eukprot:5485519-Prymnesium_polylepis.1